MPTVLTDTPPGPDDVEPAIHTLLTTMEPLALAADRRINPDRWVLSPRYASVPMQDFADRAEAISWFDAHAGTVRGCIRIAHETGRHEMAWTLCEGLWAYLHVRKDWHLWRTTHAIGVESAQHCDRAAHARMLSALGALHIWTGDLDEAERLHMRARALWISAGHELGQASGLEALGLIALKRGTPVTARSHFREARILFTDLGRERGVVLMERRIGESFCDTADYVQAATHLNAALAWFTDTGDDYAIIRTSRSLARVLQGQGRHAAARELFDDATERARALGAQTDAAELEQMQRDVAAP